MSSRKVPPMPLMSDEAFVARMRRFRNKYGLSARANPRTELESAVPAFTAALLTTRHTRTAWKVLMRVVLALPTLKDYS